MPFVFTGQQKWLCLLFLIALVCGLTITSKNLEAASQDYRTFNVAVAEHYLLPRYQRLATTTSQLATTLEQFCANPDSQTLADAQQAFHGVTDVWMGLQHITFGPITLLFRAERINHWPQRRDAVGRGLRRLLSEQDPAALEPLTFAKGSVAVQGLPALEQLLFADDVLASFTAEDDNKAAEVVYRCQVLRAIGDNLAQIGENVVKEWQAEMLPALAKQDQHSIYFTSQKAATAQLFTNLQTLLQMVTDLKLARVLGESLEKAKPRLAENRRSERSKRNIVLNLESAQALYKSDEDGDVGFSQFVRNTEQGAVMDAELQTAFDRALEAVSALPKPLSAVVTDADRRPQVEASLTAVKTLQNQLQSTVPQAADINIGFNSLDGD